MSDLAPVLVLISHVLLGGFFLVSGIRNTQHIDGVVAQLRVPLPSPRLVIMVGVGIQIVAGAMVAFNLWPALGAVALVVFLLAAIVMFHDFWNMSGAERTSHFNSTLSALALTGGFVGVVANSI